MPRFDTATIRSAFGSDAAPGLLATPQGAFATHNLPLRRLIGFAYGLQEPAIAGPESLDSERYSIDAQAGTLEGALDAMEHFRQMVRTLLDERFGFEFRWETRITPALALVVRGDTSRLRKAGAADPGPLLRLRGERSISVGNAALEPLFTDWLSNRHRALVVDRTGLDGHFNFDLRWEARAGGSAASEPAADHHDELASALRAELGLALEPIETAIETLIVERINEPSDLLPRLEPIDVDTATLDRYVGRYAFPGMSVRRVVRDGARLMLELQQPIEIFASSDAEFFAKAMPLRVKFVIEQARVTGLVLHQGGREIYAPRVDYAG